VSESLTERGRLVQDCIRRPASIASLVIDLQSELTDLRTLVGEIAEMGPLQWADDLDNWFCCKFCDRVAGWPGEIEHAPDCLWLRAQRWKP
jgi:hypothetical protein